MPLDHWKEIVRKKGDLLALRHPACPEGLTFREIDHMAADLEISGETVIAIGESLDFLPAVIAAWRTGKPVILVENRSSKVRPIRCDIPAETILIKQACGASGIERSLFFSAEQVLAEGLRNVEGLGLTPERRGVAAISLAHSYGFGCLALPLLLAGVPLEVVAGPLPMMIDGALNRGGEVFLPGVPAIWKTWWQTGVAANPVITLALSAGSPLSLDLENSIRKDCELKVHNFYGTSETGAISFDAAQTPRKRLGYVGTALPGVEVFSGKNGRIEVKSASCALGTDFPATPDEFGGETYLTLDQGEVSEEGVFMNRCIGKAINVAGRKVSASRLRAILEALDGVESATVERGFSRDFERFEEIQVRLKLNVGIDKKDLREKLRQKVENWEMPRVWEFEEE